MISACLPPLPPSDRCRLTAGVAAAVVLALTGAAAQQPQEPRFRGGTNLVRLDVYVSQNGTAVTDLTADDFEVLEDNAPQQVTSFELIQARGAVPDSARVESNSTREMRDRLAAPDTRAFVLFLDTLHVQIDGSYRAANPIARLLDRVIGADDLVGVMTPDISARNVTYSPRTTSIDRMLTDNWAWGQRGAVTGTDPREDELKQCYPDVPELGTAGIAADLIARRRERRVIAALEDLLDELERLREERTFVLLLSEGWTLPGPNEHLARVIKPARGDGQVPGGPQPVGTGPDGRLTTTAVGDRARGSQSCERERTMLAASDLGMEFRQMLQRANRANVSFYPIDPRGLVAFDAPIGPDRPPPPTIDAQFLRQRQDGLRTLAAETDGTVVLNTDIERALPRLLTDVGSYYLLGYVSTNPKLDGRYRRLTVRVKRPDVQVRARPGYLAPTAAEFSAGQTPTTGTAAGPPSAVREALSRLPGGRTTPPMYLQAAGGSGYLQITVELDRATAAAPEWANGGTMRVEIGPADASGTARQVEELVLSAGQRVYALRHPARDLLAPGRYQVRAQLTAAGARSPLTLSTVVAVPAAEALLGTAAVASRRGPGTGRLFQPTADPRFRRTERLVVETPLLATDATVSARLLNRLGQPMAVPVTLAERIDESLQLRVSLAELALAPLAPGEYVVEVTATKGTATSTVSYGFRMIP
jgi:VWFA-related protein